MISNLEKKEKFPHHTSALNLQLAGKLFRVCPAFAQQLLG